MLPANNVFNNNNLLFEALSPEIEEIPPLLQQLINDQFGANPSPFQASCKAACEARIPKVIKWLQSAPTQTISQIIKYTLRSAPELIGKKTAAQEKC